MSQHQLIGRAILLWAVAITAGIAGEVVARPPSYVITDLGTLGGPFSSGWSLNASGQVTGEASTTELISHAFVWTPTIPNGTSGVMQDLGTLGGTLSIGMDINSFGQVTGYAYTIGGANHAFLYDGSMRDLGTLGETYSEGHGVNDRGQVTGYFATPLNISVHAFLDNGVMHDLGAFGGLHSLGYDINSDGQLSGEYQVFLPGIGVENHAFLWTPAAPNDTTGTMQDLGTFGGTHSAGFGINTSGHVTGYAYSTGDQAASAFLYDGAMHDLGTLGGGGGYSAGLGINDAGYVVGESDPAGSATIRHAFLYSSANGMVDLNSLIDPLLGWELQDAQAINAAGQITGSGRIGDAFHAYLLTPIVPEPASLLLWGMGLLSVAARRSHARAAIDSDG